MPLAESWGSPMSWQINAATKLCEKLANGAISQDEYDHLMNQIQIANPEDPDCSPPDETAIAAAEQRFGADLGSFAATPSFNNAAKPPI